MNCPACGSGNKVTESRPFPDAVIRRRVCTNCGHTFFTEEIETHNAKLRISQWHQEYKWGKVT